MKENSIDPTLPTFPPMVANRLHTPRKHNLSCGPEFAIKLAYGRAGASLQIHTSAEFQPPPRYEDHKSLLFLLNSRCELKTWMELVV